MLPFQNELSVPNQLDRQLQAAHQRCSSEADGLGRDMQARDHHVRDTRASFRITADSTRAVGAMAKRSMRLLLSWTAVFVVSSTLAYALNHAVAGASTNSSTPAEMIVVSQVRIRIRC